MGLRMVFYKVTFETSASNREFSVDFGFEQRNRLLSRLGSKNLVRVFRNKNEKVSKKYET